MLQAEGKLIVKKIYRVSAKQLKAIRLRKGLIAGMVLIGLLLGASHLNRSDVGRALGVCGSSAGALGFCFHAAHGDRFCGSCEPTERERAKRLIAEMKVR